MEAKVRNCLTREEKKLILANHEECKSYSEITSIVWRSKRVVYRVISRLKADKTLKPKERTGLIFMTTQREGQIIVKMSLKDRFDTATSISHTFCESTGKPKTVSFRSDKENLVAWIPCRKPLISKVNQKVRLDFVTEHIQWIEEEWNMVPFSDGSKFILFGSGGKRRKNVEHFSP